MNAREKGSSSACAIDKVRQRLLTKTEESLKDSKGRFFDEIY